MPPYQNGFPVGYPTGNLYNPQPTQFSQPQQQQNQHKDERIFVEGEVAAKAYMTARNTTVALWDSKEPKIYLKTPDQNGNTTTMILEYKIIEPPKLEDRFITRDEFISTLNTQLSSIITELKGALNGSTVSTAVQPIQQESNAVPSEQRHKTS